MAKDDLRDNVMGMLLSKKPFSSEAIVEKDINTSVQVRPGFEKKHKMILEAEEDETDDVLEALAALEHDQWMQWAEDILKTEDINKERAERWQDLFVPYDELTEEMKELDREWARKALKITGKKKVQEKRKSVDLGSSLTKVFEAQVNNSEKKELEDPDVGKIIEHIHSSLDRDTCKSIFDNMFGTGR